MISPEDALALKAKLAAVIDGMTAAPPVPPPVVPPPVPPPVVPPVIPPPPSGVVTVTPDWITTPHDVIPNFGGANLLVVGAGQTRVWNTVDDTRYDTVRVESGGVLRFAPDAPARLRVTNLLVLPGGTLDIQTAHRAEVIFNDVPLSDVGQYSNGLIAFGTVKVRGTAKTPWVRLATEPKAGDTALHLAERGFLWNTGDRLLLPDTRQLQGHQYPGVDYQTQTERVSVASVSADGFSVTLAIPLAFDHKGARDPDGVLEDLPHVANLTRNVVFKSESAAGVRGYVMFGTGADVDVEGAQFQSLGRTTNEPFGDTNREDRFGVTFRHPKHGYKFAGNSVFCGMGDFMFRWGVGVTGGHFGTIADNVVYNWSGGGIVLQSDDCTGNTVRDNFVCHVWGTLANADVRQGTNYRDVAHEGAAYWAANFDNTFTGNVACDSAVAYDLSGFGNGWVNVPDGNGGTKTIHRQSTPLKEFAGNEGYGGITLTGIYLWGLGIGQDTNNLSADMPESVVKDLTLWHVAQRGFYNYKTNRLTFDGLHALNDSTLIGRSETFMFFAGDYHQENFKVMNSDVQGFTVGWQPSSVGVHQGVENTRFRNHQDAQIIPPWWLGAADLLTFGRTITFRNCRFDGDTGIKMQRETYKNSTNLMATTVVSVEQFQCEPGRDFRIYFKEAARDAIVEQTVWYIFNGVNLGATTNGCPEAGLTNAECFAKYGTCFGGELPPADAVEVPGVVGLVG